MVNVALESSKIREKRSHPFHIHCSKYKVTHKVNLETQIYNVIPCLLN
jgi:hypothetical protein